jgi:hypothetical protein
MFVYTLADDALFIHTGKVRLGSKYQNSGGQITGKIRVVFIHGGSYSLKHRLLRLKVKNRQNALLN